MAKAPRTRSSDEPRLAFRVIDLAGLTISYVIPWGALILIAKWMAEAVTALAGKHTVADIGLKFLANVQISEAVAYIFGAGGIGYGLLERRQRRNTIERLGTRNRDLEARIDPGRTSSGLTTRGTTSPGDSA